MLSQEEVARPARSRAGPEVQGRAQRRLRRGPARVRGRAPEGVRSSDSQRMTLRVEQGKGQRDRYVMLSPQLLVLLRAWWHAARPRAWLFPGQNPVNPITARQLNRAVHRRQDPGGDIQARVAAYAAAQLRHASTRTGRRYSGDPGVVRTYDILPSNSGLKPASATGSIRALAKWCRSDDGSKPAASSSSSCSNPTAHSPACRHG